MSDAYREELESLLAERDALRAEVERLSSALAEQESRANKFHEQAEAHAAETTELRRAICEAMGYSTKVVYPSDSEIATRVLALHERCEHQDAAFIKGAPHDEADGCPAFYDGCNCTVETLVHNIRRAERAEESPARLRAFVAALRADGLDIDDPTTAPCWTGKIHAPDGRLVFDLATVGEPSDGVLLAKLREVTAGLHASTGIPYSALCHYQDRPHCAGCPDDASCEASGREPRKP